MCVHGYTSFLTRKTLSFVCNSAYLVMIGNQGKDEINGFENKTRFYVHGLFICKDMANSFAIGAILPTLVGVREGYQMKYL